MIGSDLRCKVCGGVGEYWPGELAGRGEWYCPKCGTNRDGLLRAAEIGEALDRAREHIQHEAYNDALSSINEAQAILKEANSPQQEGK